MSENLREEEINSENCCKQCGSFRIENGYKLKLCRRCRNTFVKRPIPIKIKLFLIAMVVICLVSLIRFPKALQTGVEYERGLRAEEGLKYYTAMKHYEKVLEDYPHSEKTLVRLYNAYYQNEKIDEANKTLDKLIELSGSESVDKVMADEANAITEKIQLYYSFNEELYSKLSTLENPKPEELVSVLKPYVDNNSDLTYGAYLLANAYFDLNQFDEGISVLNKVTEKYPGFYSAILLKASSYRELGMYDDAILCCKKVLEHNEEDIAAIVALSKIELKRKNNEEGLKYANYAYRIDSNEPYVISNLSLAYHYNNNTKERDEMFTQYKSSGYVDEYTVNLLTSIYNGTLQWQK